MACRQGPPAQPYLCPLSQCFGPSVSQIQSCLSPQWLCSGCTLNWGCLLPWCLPRPLPLRSGVPPPESPISFHLSLRNAPQIPMHSSVFSLPTCFPASSIYRSYFLTRGDEPSNGIDCARKTCFKITDSSTNFMLTRKIH